MRSAANKRLAMALALTVAATAAGTQLAGAQDASQPAAPEPVDLCALVTKSEAQAALGHPVITTDSGNGCTYTVVEAGAFASLTVALGSDEITADNLGDGMSVYARAANAELRPSTDTGDDAWMALGERLSQLTAVQGRRALTIVLVNVTTSADHRATTLTQLARTALQRIP